MRTIHVVIFNFYVSFGLSFAILNYFEIMIGPFKLLIEF